MSKAHSSYRCGDCGAAAPKWVGRCQACGQWNSLVEVVQPATLSAGAPVEASRPVAIGDIDPLAVPLLATGIDEFDRVLGGGLVPGSATLVGGEPGIGKSTLLLQVLSALATAGRKCLLVSAEESLTQVRARAERVGSLPPTLMVHPETSLPVLLGAMAELDPHVVVVDSIQTVRDPDVASSAGSVLQVRECAAALTRLAKQRGIACLLVGHLTKDGSLAGPRVLEHLVDTVLSFEGDRHFALRLLRATKHRYGPTGELGLFEMGDDGLHGVLDPSGLLLTDRRAGVPGSSVVPTIEGRRPVLVEVQALTSRSSLPVPRRSALGLDGGRLSLLVAVLDQRVGVKLGGTDVYVSAVGGVRVLEPAADLAIALAVASALEDRPIPARAVAFGEVGLGGELRQVHQAPRRLAEATRLGFTQCLAPASTPPCPDGLAMVPVRTLAEAIDALPRLVGSGHSTSRRLVPVSD